MLFVGGLNRASVGAMHRENRTMAEVVSGRIILTYFFFKNTSALATGKPIKLLSAPKLFSPKRCSGEQSKLSPKILPAFEVAGALAIGFLKPGNSNYQNNPVVSKLSYDFIVL